MISSTGSRTFGVVINDVNMRSLAPMEATQIKQLVHQHGLVIFKNQDLSTQEYVQLGKKLGEIMVYLQDNYHHPEHPEIFVSSNEIRDGKKFGVAKTGNYWHTDLQFLPKPQPLTMLYPQRLPKERRETLFIDMGQVYEALPAALKAQVDGTRARHEAKWRYKVTERDAGRSMIEIFAEIDRLCPPSFHPTVIQHPITRRRILYISPGFTTAIEGLRFEESKALLDELFAFATSERHVYTHNYELGDIILWDNRTLIHRSGNVPEGEISTIYRLGLDDGEVFHA